MSDEPNESSAKSVLTEVTRSNKRVLRGSKISDEEMDATVKSEIFFNTTDGSSGRPLMSAKPSESSAKSALTEVSRSNKRVLCGSLIGDEAMDATVKSEVFFNTTDGSSGRPLMNAKPSESSAKSGLTEVSRSNKRVLRGSIIGDEETNVTLKSEVFFNTTDGSSGRSLMSDKPSESSAKSVLTEVWRSNKRVLRGSIIGDEEKNVTLKSEVFFNTTDGSSGRPLMSDEPSESSVKSVLTEVWRSNNRVLRGSIIGDEEMDATVKSEVFFNTTDGSSGRPLMSAKPSESSAKPVLTEVWRSNKRVLRGSIIGDEEKNVTLKSEVFFNTTDGSSRRPLMSDEPSESSAKSALTEVSRSNKRLLRGSIIGDEEKNVTLKSEVFFNTTHGNLPGVRETSFPVPSASKQWKNRSVYLYPTLVF
jgi:urease gamma subunit